MTHTHIRSLFCCDVRFMTFANTINTHNTVVNSVPNAQKTPLYLGRAGYVCKLSTGKCTCRILRKTIVRKLTVTTEYVHHRHFSKRCVMRFFERALWRRIVTQWRSWNAGLRCPVDVWIAPPSTGYIHCMQTVHAGRHFRRSGTCSPSSRRYVGSAPWTHFHTQRCRTWRISGDCSSELTGVWS